MSRKIHLIYWELLVTRNQIYPLFTNRCCKLRNWLRTVQGRYYSREQRSRSWLSNYLMLLAFAVLLQVALPFPAPVFADTNVYRCIAPDGKVEFRQTACADGAEEREITVEDEKTGWKPPEPGIEKKTRRAEKSHASKRKTETRSQAAQARQEEKCWKKRQALEEVNWKLRRGYKPAAGVRLRHKRRTYEEYLWRFCK